MLISAVCGKIPQTTNLAINVAEYTHEALSDLLTLIKCSSPCQISAICQHYSAGSLILLEPLSLRLSSDLTVTRWESLPVLHSSFLYLTQSGFLNKSNVSV